MDLIGLIFDRFLQSETLTALLAEYDGRSAVFYQQAKESSDALWGDVQYPRIDYTVDLQENPSRNTSGVLTVNIWCDAERGEEPEPIEKAVRELLHAAFAPADEYPFCFAWVRSDAFEGTVEKEKSIHTMGITLFFDIMACPCQYTMYPDPIKAMNQWTKLVLPESIVLGEDPIDSWILPTREKPVVYWRIAAQGTQEKHFTHTWLNITLEGHVYARTAADRLYNLVRLGTAQALSGHIPMEDTSPLFLKEYTCKPNVNYLSQGQIQASGRFGLLQPWYGKQPDPKLNHANTTIKTEEKEKQHGKGNDVQTINAPRHGRAYIRSR